MGQIRDGRLSEAIRDPSDDNYGAQFFLPLDGSFSEEDFDTDCNMWVLCSDCSCIVESAKSLPCNHHSPMRIVEQPARTADTVKKCLSCGYSGPDPIREVSHGTDGPHAVVATTLFQTLPADRRKVLAFADGRHDAAFFAWYLDSSYRELLNRNLILSAIRSFDTTSGMSIREVALALRGVYTSQRIFPASTGQIELLREAWLALYRELLSNEQRISLEGVGLIKWEFLLPPALRLPASLLEKLSMNEQDAKALVMAVLDTMRQTRAVELALEPNISMAWQDLDLQGAQTCVCIGVPASQKNVTSWDGKQTRRANLIKRLLSSRHPDRPPHDPSDVLSEIWDCMEDHDRRVQPARSDICLMPWGQAIEFQLVASFNCFLDPLSHSM